MEISLRYTPVTGRLHTRYAPVRRSSAEYCYSLLPLDLHVLSLPLAFILSQDQTLHCKNCLFLPFELSFNAFLHLGIVSKLALLSTSETVMTRLRVSHISLYVCRHTLSLSSHHVKFLLSSFCRKRVQKYNHFSNRPNIFSKKFQ